MKPYIDGIVVVEGTNDASLISSLVDVEIVTLNGYELQNIKYLKKASKVCDIYLMTDPDEQGEEIRRKVLYKIPTCIDVRIDISKCTKDIKNGVAECENNEVLRALSEFFTEKQIINKTIKVFSKSERETICKRLDIEIVNNKVLNKRINRLKITEEEIKEMLEG